MLTAELQRLSEPDRRALGEALADPAYPAMLERALAELKRQYPDEALAQRCARLLPAVR